MCYVHGCDNEYPHLHIMSFEEVYKLDSHECWNDELHDHLKRKRRDRQFNELKQSIIDHGFQPGLAPEINAEFISEGHHRIAAMEDISGQWCPWQDLENDDQYSENWWHYVYPRGNEVFT